MKKPREADFSAGSPAASVLNDGLSRMGISLPGSGVEQLLAFLRELQRWNQRFNLTAIVEPTAMVERHLLDSLSLLPQIDAQGGPVLDVGTGAGLPGVVIAVARPERSVVMVDAVAKKIRFVTHVCGLLQLGNATARHARVEALQLDRQAALAVSRAVSRPPELVAMTRHLLAPGGACIAMCAQVDTAWEEELIALGWQSETIRVRVGGLADRHLVIARELPAP